MAKRWTNDEDEYVRQERAARAPLISIALVLGRSYDAVVKRLELLRKQEDKDAGRSDQEVFYDLDEGE